jgi:hypothetical protein
VLLYSLLLLLALGGAWLLPGHELTRLLLGLWLWPLNGWGLQEWLLGKREHDFLTRASFAFALPWCLFGLLAIPAGAFGASPLPITAAAALPGVVLLFVFARGEAWPSISRPSGTTLWVLGCAVLLSLLCFLAPAQLELKSDVYAHVSAVRACLEEGRIFPLHEFYPAAQGLGADPRFGVAHAVLASWCQLSRSTPLQIWHSSLLFALPFLILATGLLARGATRRLPSMMAAHLAFLGAYAGSFYNPLRLASYPLWEALAILWAVFAFYFELPTDLRGKRRTVMLLSLALIGVMGLHALAYILGAAMLALLYFAAPRTRKRPTARTVALAILASLPFLLLRFWTAYGDVNPIHHRPYFLMQWAPGMLSASPSFLSSWLFPFGVLGIVLALVQLRAMRRQPIHFWALLMGGIALAWLTIPFLLAPSMKFLGFLPMRFTLLILFPLPIGLAVDRLLDRPASRLRGALVGLLLLCLALSTAQRVQACYRSNPSPLVEKSQWTELTAYCRQHLEADAVVLSDPFTMIALRATAPVSIVALPDGRSSPRDRDSIVRLREAWKAMSPLTDGKTTEAILQRYGVTHILVNHLFSQDLHSHEYLVDTRSFAAQGRKFSENPRHFERVWGHPGLELFAVRSAGTEWNEDYLEPGPLPRPASLDLAGGLALSDSFVLARPELMQGSQGGTRWFRIGGALCFTGEGSPEERSFVIRADLVPSPVPSGLRLAQKPVRKLLEKLHRHSYRLRWTRYPGTLPCPVYLLDRSTYLPISLKIVLPSTMVPGTYRVTLQLSQDSEFTVLSPRDFLLDDDAYQGPVVGEFTLE